MRKTSRISLFILFMSIFIVGCSEKPEDVRIQDLLDGKIEEGTKIRVTGAVIGFNEFDGKEVSNEDMDLDLSGPTQVAPLKDLEINRTVKTYNELDVTEKEFEQGEKITVEAVYIGKDEDFTIIQATKIEEE